jgi:hypothetical protein
MRYKVSILERGPRCCTDPELGTKWGEVKIEKQTAYDTAFKRNQILISYCAPSELKTMMFHSSFSTRQLGEGLGVTIAKQTVYDTDFKRNQILISLNETNAKNTFLYPEGVICLCNLQ